MLDIEEAERLFRKAMASGDKNAIYRGLHDLRDAGITEIRLVSRHITINGKQIETEVSFPSDRFRIISKGLTKAEKLLLRLKWLKDGARIMKGMPPKYFKHENEMSPEEYAWLKE